MQQAKWKEAVKELDKDDITLVEITKGWTDDLMLDHPEVSYREARVIMKNALNRAHIGRIVRKEMEYFVRTGKFREVE